MALCDCLAGLKNLGNPACTPIGGIPYKFGFALQRNNLGVVNEIDLSTPPFDEDFFLDLINDTNRTERWHFTPPVVNLTWVPQDAANATTNAGQNFRLRPGFVDVQFEMWGVSPQFAGNMEALMCASTQFVYIDNEGGLNGYGIVGGDSIKGIKIADGSMDVKYTPRTDAALSNIVVKFQLDISTQTAKLVTLPAEDIEYDLLEIADNVEVVGTTGAITTTTLTVDLGLSYGTATKSEPVTGLVVGDFVLRNETDNTTVVPSAAVESGITPGKYVLTFTAQTTGEIGTYSINKTGLDMLPVEFVYA